jgi:hypothetical protein
MNKSILLFLALLSLAVIVAACVTGNPSTGLQNEDHVVATIVAGTLSAMPTETPTAAALVPSVKLEDFPNKVFIGENDRFSVFMLNSTDPANPEQTGPILIYNKGKKNVYEIVGTFKLLTQTLIFNDDLGEYVLLSVGTYTLRTAIVISLSDKRQAVNDFCISDGGKGSYVFWNNFVIYNNCDMFRNRPWAEGEGPSIVAVNLKTGAMADIAKSDALRHFKINGIMGNTLQYEETSVRLEADWSNLNAWIKTDMTYDLSALNH